VRLPIDLLFEISVTIEQADGDEVEIEIAGRFAVIARENAKAAGIIRNRFVKAELSGEISDRFLDFAGGTDLTIGVLSCEVTAERIVDVFQFPQETFVVRDFDETGLARELKHPDRIVISPVPKLRIEMPEKPRAEGSQVLQIDHPRNAEFRRQSGNYYKSDNWAWNGDEGGREFVGKIFAAAFCHPQHYTRSLCNMGQGLPFLHRADCLNFNGPCPHLVCGRFATGRGRVRALNEGCANLR
jgi:hypothetical protein